MHVYLNDILKYHNTNLISSDVPGRVENAYIWRDYSSAALTIIWDPLPTLDLTNIDPDIVYKVELFKFTCGQNVSVSYQTVNVSSATVENLELMQIYMAVIAAKNNVPRARSGPSVEIEGKQTSTSYSLQ